MNNIFCGTFVIFTFNLVLVTQTFHYQRDILLLQRLLLTECVCLCRRSLRAWPLHRRGGLGQTQCPSHRALAQGAVHPCPRGSRVCHQPGSPCLYESLRVPGLQEAETNRSYLHLPATAKDSERSGSLDHARSCTPV